MQNSGFSLKEAVDILYGNNNYKININWHKLVNNQHKYCDELDKAAIDPKLKVYAKKDVIQLIHQIVKDNFLDRLQNRELQDIRNLLID